MTFAADDLISVRLALPEDFEEVQSMNAALFEVDRDNYPRMNFNWPYEDEGIAYFKQRINSNGSTKDGACLVAISGAVIVGYLIAKLSSSETWCVSTRTELENMYVKPECQRRGVGSKLVDRFFEWSKSVNANESYVSSFHGNTKAESFYASKGFDTFSHTHARLLQKEVR